MEYMMRRLKKLVLKPTAQCFHNCLYCESRQAFYKKYLRTESMPIAVAVRQAKDAYELGMRECLLSGGDPLLYPDLVQLISGIKQISNEIFVFMNSVGNGLSQDKAIRILDSGLGAWNFSVDTINEKKHDSIRGVKGALKKTLNAFDILREIREKYYHHRNFWINFMVVVTRHNYADLPRLFDFCIKEGVSSVFLMHVYGDHRNKRFLLKQNQVHEWHHQVVPKIISSISLSHLDTVVKQNASNVLRDFFPKDILDKYYSMGYWWQSVEQCHATCKVPDFYALIECDGTVLPCCLVEVSHEGIVGNIYDDSLATIWTGACYERFRRTKTEFCSLCSAPRHRTIGLTPELCRQFGG